MPDFKFWVGEIDRARAVRKTHEPAWQENLDCYTGQSPDAQKAITDKSEWVNVNVDFYQVEQKLAQLFYETPDLQLTAKGPVLMRGQLPDQPSQEAPPESIRTIAQAHRTLLNELLGPDHADVLTTVQKAIKSCLCPAGFGPTKICYEPTVQAVAPPAQFGAMLGLQQDVQVPIYERWVWKPFSAKKLLIPADFHDNDYDHAPWLGMEFRMPMSVARHQFEIPPDFTGTATRDEHVFAPDQQMEEASDLAYVDGVEVWYRAAVLDDDVIHPELFRCAVIIDGLEGVVKPIHRKPGDFPYQSQDGRGRLTGDSMIGNPIHVLTVRDVPDSAYVPSDSQMTRPLVRELCRFRTQMVQERDANRPYVLYDIDKLPPEVVARIENRTIGSLIGVEGGALAAGVGAIMAAAVQGSAPRQTYVANDYIEKDIAKTLALGANQTSVSEDSNKSATEITVMDRAANVRLDNERRRVLQWYLKGVAKFSALVCRFMTPELAIPYLGQQQAMLWGAWDKQASDARLAFTARPDSQIRLDAAAERKFAMDLYQFLAKDPNVRRVELVTNLLEKAGLDAATIVVEELPESKPEPNLAFSFKGEDLYNPMVREILAQGGIQVSQAAIDEAAGQLFKQVALGLRDASGKAVPAQTRPADHGGPADQVRPLSKQSADKTGNRSGPPTEVAA